MSFIQYTRTWKNAQLCRHIVGTRCAAFFGMTALFLADVHLGPLFPERCLQGLMAQLSSLSPDLVLLGGDYAESETNERHFFEAVTGTLHPPLGMYCVPGNNDLESFGLSAEAFCRCASAYGAISLVNETVTLPGGGVCIAGLDDRKHGDPHGPLFEAAGPDDLCLLLAHYPHLAYTHLSQCVRRPDLVLCGHTHGGQFRLGRFSPYSLAHFETRGLGHRNRLVSGIYELEGVQVLVTNGLGASRIPLRVGAPAQIHLITFAQA